MIRVGIDSGSQNTRAVLVKDRQILSCATVPTAFDANAAAQHVCSIVLRQAGFVLQDIEGVAVTGTGSHSVPFADWQVHAVSAAACGAYTILPAEQTLLDMGAEGFRAVHIDQDGLIAGYETNDKCAGGAGTFIEAMARALQLSIEDVGSCALQHQKCLPMNSQCVVFAESEVISLIHQREQKEDIAYSLHAGISGRMAAIVRCLGIHGTLVFIGGPARNPALIQALEHELGVPVVIPENSNYISALGAALQPKDRRQGE